MFPINRYQILLPIISLMFHNRLINRLIVPALVITYHHHCHKCVSLLPPTFAGIIDDPADSLFTYTPGENWATFYSPDFVPIYTTAFSDPELEAEANALCEGDPFCLFDVAATRRTDIGLSTLLGSQEFDRIVNLSIPGMVV